MGSTHTSRSNANTAHRGISLIQTIASVGTVVALTLGAFFPALIGLRDRNHQALCTTRIGLLARAMAMYATDFDETPPFMGIGWENILYPDQPSKSLSSTAGAPNDISSKSRWDWAVAETWVTAHPELLWNGTLSEDQWEQNGVGIRTGLMFAYARSESLYRCPEFEKPPGKVQGAFNYTRTVLGRKWISGPSGPEGKEPDYWGSSMFGAPGPIVRTTGVHNPAALEMLYDEWWWRHVGSPAEQHIPPRSGLASGGWMAVDCMNFPLGDEIGRYHGRTVPSKWMSRSSDPMLVQSGNVAFYDNHVELRRPFWPDISQKSTAQYMNGIPDIVRYINQQAYAQRGKEIMRELP